MLYATLTGLLQLLPNRHFFVFCLFGLLPGNRLSIVLYWFLSMIYYFAMKINLGRLPNYDNKTYIIRVDLEHFHVKTS